MIQHETQHTGAVGHSVGAVKDYKTVVAFVFFLYEFSYLHPNRGLYIRRVYGGSKV